MHGLFGRLDRSYCLQILWQTLDRRPFSARHYVFIWHFCSRTLLSWKIEGIQNAFCLKNGPKSLILQQQFGERSEPSAGRPRKTSRCQNKCKWDILDDFQTTWASSFWHKNTNFYLLFYSVTIAIIWSFTQTNGSVSFPTTRKLCLVHIAVFKRLILPRICLQFSCEEMKDPCVSRESIPPKIHHHCYVAQKMKKVVLCLFDTTVV